MPLPNIKKQNQEEKIINKKLSKKRIILGAFVVILLLVLGAACFFVLTRKEKVVNILKGKKDISSLVKKDSSKKQQLGLFKMNIFFAEFPLEETNFSPQLPNHTINTSELTNLTNFEKAESRNFSISQKQTLDQDNFFIAENMDKFYQDNPDDPVIRPDDWTKLYGQTGGGSMYERKPENSVFVTTDFLLHVYHKLLEKEFEYIEQKEFYPRLKEITDKAFEQSVKNYNSADKEENKKSFQRLTAFFAVPKAILDSAYSEFSADNFTDTKVDSKENILSNLDKIKTEMSGDSYEKARQELELILAQKALNPSPLFGEFLRESGLRDIHDYTQYGPRSHYNKTSILRTYFRAMIWYGRNYFAVSSPDLTRDAIHITLMLKQVDQTQNWEDIYVPTAFFVGLSDDLGIYEYGEVISNSTKVDNSLVEKVQKEMEKYQNPQIMSSAMFGEKVFELTKEELQAKTKGFRFMGQRFTPDAFIFSSLTQGDEKPDPETGESLPSMPTALMVMSVLGNKTAKPLNDQWIEENALSSKRVLAKKMNILTQQFDAITEDVWTQNIYWGWLYTIKSLFTEIIDKTGYPNFMKNEFWNKKSLQAALGSWTELKHDTLLYTKQSYAEIGAGGPQGEPPPVPKGYVEPNIKFFDRLIALSLMTQQGLLDRGLLDNVFVWRNEEFINALKFFREISVKQLQNESISDDDFERLRVEPSRLSNTLSALPGETQTENNARSALIADVHTDAAAGQILYEATGIPNYIYVAVKDKNGTRLTKGLVFSYYEFAGPLGERLNDEKWREINYTDDKSEIPEMSEWNRMLIK